MSQTQAEYPPDYGIVSTDPLCLHNPDRGIVIDVWDRTESKAEKQLTETYRYRVEVSENQSTEYRGVFADRESAVQKAYELSHEL